MAMVAQSRSLCVLLTRPAAQGDRFATELGPLLGKGARVVTSPLLVPRYVAAELPLGPFHALILTSETGAEAARRIIADGAALPDMAFCVGDRTAAAARAAGFQARSAGKDAAALLALLLDERVPGPLLHLRGRDSRGGVVGALNAARTEACEVIVYEQEAKALTAEAVGVLQSPGLVLVPLFSPRTARLFAAAVRGVSLSATLQIAALSPAVEAQILPEALGRVDVAAHPDAAAMLSLVSKLATAARCA